jgi:transcriptional regulator with XRE-family HTH domain
MKDRLLKFLTREQLSSARFAEIIGVQPSGISHILSGRNKPGFDFIQKILENYPSLNAEWLIMGRGSMFKPETQGDLFSQGDSGYSKSPESTDKMIHTDDGSSGIKETFNDSDAREQPDTNVIKGGESESYSSKSSSKNSVTNVIRDNVIEKIVIFYSDRTFSEYSPGE